MCEVLVSGWDLGEATPNRPYQMLQAHCWLGRATRRLPRGRGVALFYTSTCPGLSQLMPLQGLLFWARVIDSVAKTPPSHYAFLALAASRAVTFMTRQCLILFAHVLG
jgi:hypothetical protein